MRASIRPHQNASQRFLQQRCRQAQVKKLESLSPGARFQLTLSHVESGYLTYEAFSGQWGRDAGVCEVIKRRERELASAASNLRAATDGVTVFNGSCGPSGFVLPIAFVRRGGEEASRARRRPGYPFVDIVALMSQR